VDALRRRVEAHFAEYELPQYTGLRVADLPTCNDWQPWQVTPDEARERARKR
jgi:hypothetical protein